MVHGDCGEAAAATDCGGGGGDDDDNIEINYTFKKYHCTLTL